MADFESKELKEDKEQITNRFEGTLPASETKVIAAREKCQEVLSAGEKERKGYKSWLPGQREKINIKVAEQIKEVLNVYDSIRDENLIDTDDIRVIYRTMDFFMDEKDQTSQDTYHMARDVYDKVKLKLPKKLI